METTINGVYTGGKRNRRVRALARLKEQLKSGAKPHKAKDTPPGTSAFILLTDVETKRIEKEISILESKL